MALHPLRVARDKCRARVTKLEEELDRVPGSELVPIDLDVVFKDAVRDMYDAHSYLKAKQQQRSYDPQSHLTLRVAQDDVVQAQRVYDLAFEELRTTLTDEGLNDQEAIRVVLALRDLYEATFRLEDLNAELRLLKRIIRFESQKRRQLSQEVARLGPGATQPSNDATTSLAHRFVSARRKS